MTQIDQFESAFRSAAKAMYHYHRLEFDRVLVVIDFDESEAGTFLAQVRGFLGAVDRPETSWQLLGGDEFGDIAEILDAVHRRAPDLIVTYRHLHSSGWQWSHGLGEYLDVLTQATDVPILVLPHPDAERALPHTLRDTDCVMAITDHLTGDDRLVNHAVALTQERGHCYLTHIEDDAVFDRLLEVIGKIPTIDTEHARRAIKEQLLKEPRDYIRSCREILAQKGREISIEKIVAMGHRLREYRRLIDEHAVDLLVMNTKDEDQLAMHGLAYPLAVELREIPLLML